MAVCIGMVHSVCPAISASGVAVKGRSATTKVICVSVCLLCESNFLHSTLPTTLTYMYMYVYIYIYTYMYIHVHYIHVYTYVCTYVYVYYTCIYVHAWRTYCLHILGVCVCVCVCVCARAPRENEPAQYM